MTRLRRGTALKVEPRLVFLFVDRVLLFLRESIEVRAV
jgi:hypothetical protein